MKQAFKSKTFICLPLPTFLKFKMYTILLQNIRIETHFGTVCKYL